MDEEEVDDASLEGNEAHEGTIWTDLWFSQVQGELLAVEILVDRLEKLKRK